MPAVLLSPFTTGLLYGATAGWAARQVVTVWRGTKLQADVAAGLAAAPVLASVIGVPFGVVVLVLALAGGAVFASQEPVAGLSGGAGRLAAAGVMVQAVGPVAVAGGAMVLLTAQNPVVAGMLLMMVSAYEVGDFIVGSGGVTPVEGPIAGGLAMVLIGFPGALVFLEPFDEMEVWLLGVVPVAALFGQWVASAMLPRPDADASALRRIDTLLVLAPIWVAAAGAF